MWYTKESIQEVIYLSSLSLHVAKGMERPDVFIQELLEKENKAGYRVQQLLS
jgi:superfamily I DNA/RNA helicase